MTKPSIQQQTLEKVTMLAIKLYGENGFEGDIPEIKGTFKNHEKRLRRSEIVLAGIVSSGVLGGGIAGLVQLLT